MIDFPRDLYTDVRTEEVYETSLLDTKSGVEIMRVRGYEAGFVRSTCSPPRVVTTRAMAASRLP